MSDTLHAALDPGLDRLSNLIRDEIISGVRCCHDAIRHWLEAGRLLCESKDRLPYGRWEEWLYNNLDMGARQARRYMELWDKRAIIAQRLEEGETFLSIEGTLKAIAPQRDIKLKTDVNAVVEKSSEKSESGLPKSEASEEIGSQIEEAFSATEEHSVHTEVAESTPSVQSSADSTDNQESEAEEEDYADEDDMGNILLERGVTIDFLDERCDDEPKLSPADVLDRESQKLAEDVYFGIPDESDIVPIEDKEWLKSLSLYERLRGFQRKAFVVDALFWRRNRLVNTDFAIEMADIHLQAEKDVGLGGSHGSYYQVFLNFTACPGPNSWAMCPKCSGNGKAEHGYCPRCGGCGYLIY